MKTKLSREQLETNAKALGFDHTDEAALIAAAMVSDEEFREKVTRFFFEKARRDLGLDLPVSPEAGAAGGGFNPYNP